MKSEKIVQKEILQYLKSIGCYSIKTVVCNRDGISDLIVCFEGRFIGIEVKSESKGISGLSARQKLELRNLNDSGGFGFCSNSLEHTKSIFIEFLMLF